MTAVVLSNANGQPPIDPLFATAIAQQQSYRRKIEIVAFIALTFLAAAIAAITGLVLSGVVAAIVSASASVLLGAIIGVVYRVLEAKNRSHPVPVQNQFTPQPTQSIKAPEPTPPTPQPIPAPKTSTTPSIAPIQVQAPAIVPVPQWTVAMLKDRVVKSKEILMERIKIEQAPKPKPQPQPTPPSGGNTPSIPGSTGYIYVVPAAVVVAKSKLKPLEPLPKLCDLDKYVLPFSLDYPMKDFSNCDLARKMEELHLLAIKQSVYKMSLVNTPMQYISYKLLGLLSCQYQVFGFRRYAAFLESPNNWKELFLGKIPPPPGLNHYKILQGLETEGQNLIKKLLQRLEWLTEIFTKESTPFDPQLCIEFIGTDIEFLNEINVFTDGNEKIEKCLQVDGKRWDEYRDQERKEIMKKDDWPHSVNIFNDIVKAGFDFRPMMTKRDRCACNTCNAEVSGWRPWMNPKNFHVAAKHQPPVPPVPQPPKIVNGFIKI